MNMGKIEGKTTDKIINLQLCKTWSRHYSGIEIAGKKCTLCYFFRENQDTTVNPFLARVENLPTKCTTSIPDILCKGKSPFHGSDTLIFTLNRICYSRSAYAAKALRDNAPQRDRNLLFSRRT